MKKATLLLASVLIFVCMAVTRSRAQAVFLLSVTDSAAISSLDTVGSSITATFADPGIDGIVHSMPLRTFRSAFVGTPNGRLKEIYRVEGADSAYMNMLLATDSVLFPGYRLEPAVALMDYYPNDWSGPGYSSVNYLQFIGAPRAWNDTTGSKGDSSIIIGITDKYFDITNPDFQGKALVVYGNDSPCAFEAYHGTPVACLAAGGTDNDTLLPSIGFKCRLNLSTYMSTSGMSDLHAAAVGGTMKVMNGSWAFYAHDYDTLYLPPEVDDELAYDGLYEQGVSCCFAAGNARPKIEIRNTSFMYPASYDHNISVSSVGHVGDTGTEELKYVHDMKYNGTDTAWSYNHNNRVDICAPAMSVDGNAYWTCDTTTHVHNLTLCHGTSFASPIVAGTLALMYSANSCITPYQAEWLLKKNAYNMYTHQSLSGSFYNAKYAGPTQFTGKLGAGALKADDAVIAAKKFECNDSTTRTFYIESVTLNHKCAPGTVGAAPGLSKPQLKVTVKNGTPPYRYLWEPILGNGSVLDNAQSDTPKVLNGARLYYRLVVYDNSEIQKVASQLVNIKLTRTLQSDLAMRDSYYDVLDEPNTQKLVNSNHDDIWNSPDLWNRDTADGGLTYQDPEYYTTGSPNYIYVRVRNVGCVANQIDASELHLYWTASSAGEHWSYDWDGTTHVASSGSPLPAVIPAGGEITSGSVAPPTVPVLQPGQDTIMSVPWYPTKPENFYKSPDRVAVCVLARLLETSLVNNGIHTAEVTRTATNINENNNIVTRNFALIDKGRKCASCRTTSGGTPDDTRRVYIANAEDHDQVFTLEMISQKDIEKHLSGDLSKYLYVTLSLDSLYDRWQAAGGHGNYAAVDAQTRTVTYDPSVPLHLEGINLHAGEHFPVDISFIQRSGVSVPNDINDFKLYIRQLIWEGKGNKVYGSVVYSVSVAATGGSSERSASQNASNAAAIRQSSPYYSVYPNPASGILNVRYSGTTKTTANLSLSDVSGKEVIRKSSIAIQPGGIYSIRLAALSAGIYFIHIEDASGNTSTQQITKE